MQDQVGAAADRLDIHLTGLRLKQGQNLAGATSNILVRLRSGTTLSLPAAARIRHRLERTGLVFAPDREAERGAERVGALDEPLFSAASRSVTVITTPSRLRLRTTTPVSHQLRLRCQLKPAACKVRPIV